jgi:hypothetical protein
MTSATVAGAAALTDEARDANHLRPEVAAVTVDVAGCGLAPETDECEPDKNKAWLMYGSLQLERRGDSGFVVVVAVIVVVDVACN